MKNATLNLDAPTVNLISVLNAAESTEFLYAIQNVEIWLYFKMSVKTEIAFQMMGVLTVKLKICGNAQVKMV